MNNLNTIKFPALLVAEDGWVQLFESPSELSKWNYIGINKYSKRRVLLYDSSDGLWLLKEIIPEKKLTFLRLLLAQTFYNPRVSVSLSLDHVPEKGNEVIVTAIKRAIDMDDDILTQWSTAEDIKKAIENKHRFRDIVSALKKTRAI